MNEYFISGEITKAGKTFAMVISQTSALNAFREALELIAKETDTKEEDIYIKTLNKC